MITWTDGIGHRDKIPSKCGVTRAKVERVGQEEGTLRRFPPSLVRMNLGPHTLGKHYATELYPQTPF